MVPIGVNDVHAMHTGLKIVHVYVLKDVTSKCELAVFFIFGTIEKKTSWAHIDTKNKTIT